MHAEINGWLRQIQRTHRSTLSLKLQVLRVGKLMSHLTVLYAPRQMLPQHVLARRLGQSLWRSESWREWTQEDDRSYGAARARLPLAAQRSVEEKLVRDHACANVRKRPAAADPKKRKKTAFSLHRSQGIKRSGVHMRHPSTSERKAPS